MSAYAAPPARLRHTAAAVALRCRPLVSAMAACSLLTLPHAAHGQSPLPTGASIAAGEARIATSGRTMTVTNSASAILNWQSFSIGTDHAVRFEQPDAASRVLNRVIGRDPSSILGSLSSNGAVWLLNPNGVLFGAGARIDVGALVASTLRIDDAAWLRGRYSFAAGAADAPSTVINRGELRSSLGGTIALVGDSVRNEGLIQADGGQVVLAAGRSVELVDSGAPNLGVRITAPSGEALNLGRLLASAGRIDIHAATVNQQGIVRADGLRDGPGGSVSIVAGGNAMLGSGSTTTADGSAGGGSVRVESQQGRTTVQGAVSADSRDGAGGSVQLFGAEVGLLDGARVSASGSTGGGEVLVGGGARGQDARHPNANAVYVAPQAVLSVDAGSTGDGGRIVVWSDHSTRAFGAFSARGGSQAGDGGLVETSGGWLDARPGRIDVSAPHGKTGGWLLDPHDITISNGETSTQGVDANYTATSDNSSINAGDLQRSLDAGTNVTISTGGATDTTGTQPGDVSFSFANIRLASASPGSLTVLADRNVTFDSSSYVSASPSSFSIRTGSGSGPGAFSMSRSQIDTGGGDFSVGGSIAATDSAGQAYRGAQGLSGRPAGISITDSSIDARGGSIALQGIGVPAFEPPDFYNSSSKGVAFVGTTLQGRSIVVQGSTSAPQGTGIAADSTRLSATHDIALRGAGGGYGVDFSDSSVRLLPDAIDATAKLEMRGLGEFLGLQLTNYGSSEAVPLVVGNGATVDLAGSTIRGAEGSRAVVLEGSSPYPDSTPTLDGSSAGDIGISSFGSGDQGVYVAVFRIQGSPAPLSLASVGRLDINSSTVASTGALRLAGRDINLDAARIDGAAIDIVAERNLSSYGSDIGSPTSTTLSLLAGRGGAGGSIRLDSSNIETSGGSLLLGGGATGVDADGGSFAGAGGGMGESEGDADGVLVFSSTLLAGTGELRIEGVGPSGTSGAIGVRVVESTLTGGVVTLRGAADAGSGIVVEGSVLTARNNLNLVGFGASPGVLVADRVFEGEGGSYRVGSQLSVSAANATGTGRQLRINGVGLVGSGVVITTADGSAPVLQADQGASILLKAATDEPQSTALVLQGAGVRSESPFATTGSGSLDTLADSTTLDALSLASTTGAIGLNRLQGASRLALTDTVVDSGGAVRLGAQSVTLGGSGSVRSTAVGDAIVVADAAGPVTAFRNRIASSAPGTTPGSGAGSGIGASALQAPNGRWIVYAASPTDPRFDPGALPYDFKRYSAAAQGWAADVGNGFVFSEQRFANYSGSFTTRVYDAGLDARVQSLSVVPDVPGDTARVGSGVSARLASRNAGTGVAASLAGTDAIGFVDADGKPVYGYAFSGRLTGDITPAPLAVAGLAAQGKVYDATPLATLTGTPSVAPLGRDSVVLSGIASGRFADRNVGSAKPVAVGGLALGGADAGNYRLQLPTLAADITPAPLAVAGLAAQGKVYDATVAATLTGTPSIAAPYAGDSVTLAGTASGRFADRNVGSSKPVAVGGLSLGGTDAGNYRLQRADARRRDHPGAARRRRSGGAGQGLRRHARGDADRHAVDRRTVRRRLGDAVGHRLGPLRRQERRQRQAGRRGRARARRRRRRQLPAAPADARRRHHPGAARRRRLGGAGQGLRRHHFGHADRRAVDRRAVRRRLGAAVGHRLGPLRRQQRRQRPAGRRQRARARRCRCGELHARTAVARRRHPARDAALRRRSGGAQQRHVAVGLHRTGGRLRRRGGRRRCDHRRALLRQRRDGGVAARRVRDPRRRPRGAQLRLFPGAGQCDGVDAGRPAGAGGLDARQGHHRHGRAAVAAAGVAEDRPVGQRPGGPDRRRRRSGRRHGGRRVGVRSAAAVEPVAGRAAVAARCPRALQAGDLLGGADPAVEGPDAGGPECLPEHRAGGGGKLSRHRYAEAAVPARPRRRRRHGCRRCRRTGRCRRFRLRWPRCLCRPQPPSRPRRLCLASWRARMPALPRRWRACRLCLRAASGGCCRPRCRRSFARWPW